MVEQTGADVLNWANSPDTLLCPAGIGAQYKTIYTLDCLPAEYL